MEQAAKQALATPVRGLALRVDLQRTNAGVVELAPAPEHRVKVHAGEPTRGECQAAPFVYARGVVDIMPAGSSDRWLQHDTSTSVVLALPRLLWNHVAQELGLDPANVTLEPQNHLRDARIEHIAWALEAERGEGNPAGTLYAESLGTALTAHLIGRYHKPRALRARGLSKPQLTRVTEYIEAYLDRDLSLERLAAVAGLSMTHFKALFRRSTGLPVHAYVVQRRVERARALLARGDLPISQVALEAGFAHQSHMARTLRRHLGVAPSALLRSVESGG